MCRFRMFIDDTGSVHNPTTNHPQQRYGGIVGVVFDLDYLRDVFEPEFDRLREYFFGRLPDGSLPILHLRKMKKADPRGSFGKLWDPVFRGEWETELLRIYREISYVVICVAIDKVAHYFKFPEFNDNVYGLLVSDALDCYRSFLRGRGSGDVLTEATNSQLDNELRAMFSKYCDEKSNVPDFSLSSYEIKIKPKAANIVGLQFADLLASTCLQHLRRTYANGGEYDSFAMQVADIIEKTKFHRHEISGEIDGFGRVWHPNDKRPL